MSLATDGQTAAHIVWDWNGTLLHDIHAVIGATNAAFAELGLAPITLERYRELYCVPVPKFYERLMGRLPTDAGVGGHGRVLPPALLAAGTRRRSGRGRRRVAGGAEARGAQPVAVFAGAARPTSCRSYGRTASLSHFVRVDGRTGPSGGSKAEHMARHLAARWTVSRRIAPSSSGTPSTTPLAAAHVGARAVLYTGGSHSRASLEEAGVPVVDSLEEAVEAAERLANTGR